jgi:hypothetical protein
MSAKLNKVAEKGIVEDVQGVVLKQHGDVAGHQEALNDING